VGAMKTKIALIVIFFAGAAFGAYSQESGALRFSGEANADIGYVVSNPFETAGGPSRVGSYASASSIRLDAVGGNRDSAKVEVSVLSGLAHLDGAIVPLFDVKKLFVSVYTDFADISAGRMIVNFGRGTIFSPVDLFSSADLGDLNFGRIGMDAVRVLVPFGDFSGLDLVAAMAEKPEDTAAGGKLYADFSGWDVGVCAFRDRSAFFGFDFKGDAIVGVSGEAAARIEESGARYRFMGGLDYSIGGEWFFDLEYLANVVADDPTLTESFDRAHNLFASVLWAPDKLTAVGIRAVGSAEDGDGRWLATFTASRGVARGATLVVYAQYSSGDVEGTAEANADTPAAAFGTRLSVAF